MTNQEWTSIEKLVDMIALVSELKAENKLLKEWNDELRKQKNISSNFHVSQKLPTTEDVKRWYAILVGMNEDAMQKDMEATFG